MLSGASASPTKRGSPRAVLGYNYPGSKWYADTYALVAGDKGAEPAQESWYARVFASIF